MKIRYSRDEDILIIETASGEIDYAEEMGQFIIHYTKDKKPVMLEIQDASEFLSLATKSSITAQPLDFS